MACAVHLPQSTHLYTPAGQGLASEPMSPDRVVSPLLDQYLPLLVKKRISSMKPPLRTHACVIHSLLARVNAGLASPPSPPRQGAGFAPYVNLIASIQLPDRTSTCKRTGRGGDKQEVMSLAAQHCHHPGQHCCVDAAEQNTAACFARFKPPCPCCGSPL